MAKVQRDEKATVTGIAKGQEDSAIARYWAVVCFFFSFAEWKGGEAHARVIHALNFYTRQKFRMHATGAPGEPAGSLGWFKACHPGWHVQEA